MYTKAFLIFLHTHIHTHKNKQTNAHTKPGSFSTLKQNCIETVVMNSKCVSLKEGRRQSLHLTVYHVIWFSRRKRFTCKQLWQCWTLLGKKKKTKMCVSRWSLSENNPDTQSAKNNNQGYHVFWLKGGLHYKYTISLTISKFSFCWVTPSCFLCY